VDSRETERGLSSVDATTGLQEKAEELLVSSSWHPARRALSAQGETILNSLVTDMSFLFTTSLRSTIDQSRAAKWFRRTLVAGSLVVLMGILVSCGGETLSRDVRVLRLGHGLDPSHPVHKAMEFMAERVAEKSDSTLRIEIYPSEQLGTERQCLELLQIGSLDMAKVSAAVMQGFVPAYKALSMPYIYESEAHRFRVMEGKIGREILRMGTGKRLRGLTFYDAGSRSFYTNGQPIRTPGDLKGMKVRTMSSQTAIEMTKMLGGSPTPMSWGEVYTALQQGVVDGAENNPPTYHLSRQYEVTDYYSLDKHTAVPDVLLTGTQTWSQLSETERQWLQEAARESAQHQKKLWEKATQEALEAVKEAGVTIIRPDTEPFAEKVRPMYEQYRDQEQVYHYIQRIQDAAQDTVETPPDTSGIATKAP